MSDPRPPQRSFGETMAEAQELHSQGSYVTACMLWAEASEKAPSDLDFARAVRSFASSADCMGIEANDIARVHAIEAFNIHDELVKKADDSVPLELLRERVKSAVVVGHIMLRSLHQPERAGALDEARPYFTQAREDIMALRAQGQPTEQLTAALVSRLALHQII